jgi:hypothetical protein
MQRRNQDEEDTSKKWMGWLRPESQSLTGVISHYGLFINMVQYVGFSLLKAWSWFLRIFLQSISGKDRSNKYTTEPLVLGFIGAFILACWSAFRQDLMGLIGHPFMHLVSVMRLFLYMPYTKFAHIVYRIMAMCFEKFRESGFAQSTMTW